MLRDPRYAGARPPFPLQQQPAPGETAKLDPLPDHGEDHYRGCERLKGCAALITGGDSGIGRAVAIAFAREGANVLIAHLNEHRDAEETASWVRKAGARAAVVAGDLSDESHCRELISSTMKEFGRLDVLVNNAAYQRTHENLEDFSSAEIDRTFRVNILSMF